MMSYFTILVLTVLVIVVLQYRIGIIEWKPQPLDLGNKNGDDKSTKNRNLMCFLGSGGHTMEMIELLKSLDAELYSPRIYLLGDTDTLSRDKLQSFEKGINKSNNKYRAYSIPRAREVGQSWISTPFSTIKTLLACTKILMYEEPDCILANGPGSCVPLFLLAKIIRLLRLKKGMRLIYIESFARVETLSLSGKILYPFCDMFLVQWPNLLARYPKAKFAGILV